MATRILVVEDELIVAHSIKATLERSNYQVVTLALSRDEAIQAAADLRPDVVLMDIRLDSEHAGSEAATVIRERFDTPTSFGEDFFYRIHVLVIRVPALRERKDDIPLLAEHFFQACYQAGYPAAASHPDGESTYLPGEIVDQRYTHTWPGNVRKLQNVLRRLPGIAPKPPKRWDLRLSAHIRSSTNPLQ